MAALIVPKVCRYALVGAWPNARPIVNVIDMEIPDNVGEDRVEACITVGEDLRNAWQDHVLNLVSQDYLFVRVDYVDLDSADGSTGTLSPDPGRKTRGDINQAPLPPSDAVIISKVATSARGQRSGRIFLSGAPEMYVDQNGVLIPSYRTLVDDNMDNFLESISDTGIVGVEKYPVVVHARTSTSSRVRSMPSTPLIGRQSRRIGR